MSKRYRTESTLSDRGQTAIPSSIRKYLGLAGGGKIAYEIDDTGQVVMSAKAAGGVDNVDSEDPALAPFLSLLEQDIEEYPTQIAPMASDFLAVAIAIAGSWEALVDFDPSGFEFTDDDAAELSELFSEIEAEEGSQ